MSSEGTTQGDPLAMQFYALGTNPLLRFLQSKVPEVSQVWLADVAMGAGKLPSLKAWCDLKSVRTDGQSDENLASLDESIVPQIFLSVDDFGQSDQIFARSENPDNGKQGAIYIICPIWKKCRQSRDLNPPGI